MAPPLPLRPDYDANRCRQLARQAKDPDQVRRLLAIAAVYDGASRSDAAEIGGMDRQILRDWVTWFNKDGHDALVNHKTSGPPKRLTEEQLKELADLVESGPNRAVQNISRWRSVDLRDLIKERWGVSYHVRTIGKILKSLNFSHISARRQAPAQDQAVLEDYKKRLRRRGKESDTRLCSGDATGVLVSR